MEVKRKKSNEIKYLPLGTYLHVFHFITQSGNMLYYLFYWSISLYLLTQCSCLFSLSLQVKEASHRIDPHCNKMQGSHTIRNPYFKRIAKCHSVSFSMHSCTCCCLQCIDTNRRVCFFDKTHEQMACFVVVSFCVFCASKWKPERFVVVNHLIVTTM